MTNPVRGLRHKNFIKIFIHCPNEARNTMRGYLKLTFSHIKIDL